MELIKSFGKVDEWLNITGFISKYGVILGMIGCFLMIVSFIVGVQIIVFIPAFIISIFVYSYYEVRHVEKNIELFWEKKGNSHVLHMLWHQPRAGNYFQIAIITPEKKEIIYPQNQKWILHKESQYVLIIQGKFHLIRKHIAIPPLPEIKDNSISHKTGDYDEYFQIKVYEPGDDVSKIHPIKTAQSSLIFLKQKIQEFSILKSEEHQKTEQSIGISSNAELERRKDIHQGNIIEWMMIFTGILAAELEWHHSLFTLFSLVSGMIVIARRYGLKKSFFPKKHMQYTVLVIFGWFIYQALLSQNLVTSGVQFLILFSIAKQLFEREIRDGITYMFITLFVFVSISMFNLNFWFIIAFTLFLFQSLFIIRIYSSGEKAHQFERSFGTRMTKRANIQTIAFVFILMFGLFFTLPHGEREKAYLSSVPEKSNTGFHEEVSLNDVLQLKKDFGKQFVLENAKKERINAYQNLYWRGMRFDEFHNGKWEKIDGNIVSFPYAQVIKKIPTEKMNIKFYMDGQKNIFLPKIPVNILTSGMKTIAGDRSIAQFFNPEYSTHNIEIEVIQTENQYYDFITTSYLHETYIDGEVQKIMKEFWESIPQEIIDSPNKITNYIQNEAGFSYSIDNPAKNIEDFLYSSKQGHCEYFATTLALTLQHFGFQATLVNGFHGGEWNDIAQAWIVRKLNAHSWVEVWDDQNGAWTTYDATPYGTEVIPWFKKISLINSAIQYYDVIELHWFNNFVQFNAHRQKKLLGLLGSKVVFILISILIGILLYHKKYLYKTYIRPIRNLNKKERFMRWLSKRTKEPYFLLQSFEEKHPDLVSKTREAIYGNNTIPLKEVKKMWKKIV